jgi:hypothetical protein
MLTPSAIHYCWQQLIQRIDNRGVVQRGIQPQIGGITFIYGAPDTVDRADAPAIVVVPCAPTAWHALIEQCRLHLPHAPLAQLLPPGARLPFAEPLPILFWGDGYEDGGKPFAEQWKNGTVVIYADILAATFFMLSRWEETVVPIRDQHGRFPATASVAHKQGFLDRPIVDEYALILQAWLQTLLPNWTPQTPRFSVKVSHDIDHVRQFRSLFRAGRVLAGDLLKRRSLHLAGRTLQSLIASRAKPDQDPYLRGVYDLADISEQHGLTSSFYFMTAQPGPYDAGYAADESLRRCIDNLRQRKHEIGFHPGYCTPEDPDRFAAEKARMDALVGIDRYGGRQHYLRFRTPDTWRLWEQAGLTYDSTLSYADHEGFRCGTCHPYRPFDVEQDRQLDLLEIPLIVMDGTLKQYRKLTPEEGEERILALAKRCKQVNGVFTLLWHNTSLQGEWGPWAAMYHRVMPQLAALVNEEYLADERVQR